MGFLNNLCLCSCFHGLLWPHRLLLVCLISILKFWFPGQFFFPNLALLAIVLVIFTLVFGCKAVLQNWLFLSPILKVMPMNFLGLNFSCLSSCVRHYVLRTSLKYKPHFPLLAFYLILLHTVSDKIHPKNKEHLLGLSKPWAYPNGRLSITINLVIIPGIEFDQSRSIIIWGFFSVIFFIISKHGQLL